MSGSGLENSKEGELHTALEGMLENVGEGECDSIFDL